MSWLQRYHLPVLSLPFAIVTGAIYLSIDNVDLTALLQHNTNAVLVFDDWLMQLLPAEVTAFFQSMGIIVFIPSPSAGILIFLSVLLQSRLLAALAIAGYLLSALLFTILEGSPTLTFTHPYAFNASLACMAIGGVFLKPSWRSVLLSLFGVALAVMLIRTFEFLTLITAINVPILALPFNLVVLTMLYTMIRLRSTDLASFIAPMPESAAQDSSPGESQSVSAPPSKLPRIHPPFTGRGLVSQGFHGNWTHRGEWAHALDFIIVDEEQRDYRNNGGLLTDYYAYHQPVLAPVSGTVVSTVTHLADNSIDRIPVCRDWRHNWGNHVILRSTEGYYVELSHFSPASIVVKPGQNVTHGQLLGLCGNSGYSARPHIHLQVQTHAGLGAGTRAFCLLNLQCNDKANSAHCPKTGDWVESYTVDLARTAS